MHIAEGVAPASVAAIGTGLACAAIAVGLRAIKDEQIPRAALLAAAIFVASLIRLPVGPSSVHPVLNGLVGLVLGWGAMPVFVVVLFLEALLFQFGGLTTLGINTLVMGLPAVLCYTLYTPHIRRCHNARRASLLGAAAGATALLASFGLWAGALILCGNQFSLIITLAALPHLVITAVEAVFTGVVVGFLVRVYPSAFRADSAPPERQAS